MNSLRASVSLALAAGLVLAGCSGGGGAAGWDDFADRFLDSTFEANPHFAVYQGRHEFDGKLPDWSEDGLRAEIARLKEFRQAAEAFDPSALDDRRRLEREHVLAQIDGDLFWLETAEAPWRNPAFYRGVLDPNVYASRPYAPLPERMKAITKWAQNIPHALEQVRASVRTYKGRQYADLRVYYHGDDNEYHPSRKGLTVSLDRLEDLEEAVRKLRAAVDQN